MKVFEFFQDVDGFCPWDAEGGSVERIRDRVPIGTPVGKTWRPLRGAIRPISGLEQGDFPAWVDPVMSGRVREGLGDLLDPWGEWLPLESTDGDEFFVYNVTTVLDCIDHERSRFKRLPSGKPYLANRLYFQAERIDALCFCTPEGLTQRFYMLGDVVDRIARLGLRGLAPLELWDSELGSRYIGL